MIRLIALNGSMGVGKSEAYKFIVKTLGHDRVVLLKFASPLYEIQEFVYKTISPVYTRPDTFIKDRKLLQWIGTEWGRETINQSLWVDLWKANAKSLLESYIVICDDVRYSNEADTVRQLGGIVVNITSNQNVNRIDTKAGISNHPSEAGLSSDKIDLVIENNGTIEDYRNSLTQMLKQFNVIT